MRIPDRNRASATLALRKNIIHPLTGLAFVVLLATLFFPLFGRLGVDYEPFDWICLPNGRPLAPRFLRTQIYGTTRPYSMSWNPDLILSPTMRWGHLKFASAKAIDIAWDLLAGRLGQFALAFYMCPVLQRVMLQEMEASIVPMDLYSSLTIDRVSPWFIWTLMRKGKPKTMGARSFETKSLGIGIGTILSMLYIACYILGFQTILSIATSYQARKIPAVHDTAIGGGLLDISMLRVPGLVLRDGWRVGLKDDTALCFSEEDPDDLCQLFYTYASAIARLPGISDVETMSPAEITDSDFTATGQWLIWPVEATPNSPAQYHSNFTISNTTYTLQPPTLNIESVPAPPGSRDPIFKDATTAWLQIERTLPYLTLNGALLNLTRAEELVECVPSEHYEWGFSFLLLFIFMVLTILFLSVLAWLQYNLHWHSRVDVIRPTLSQYCDVLAMAQEVRAELGRGVEDMTWEEIQELVKRKGHVGMGLDVDELPISRKEQKRNKSGGDGGKVEFRSGRDGDCDMDVLVRKTGALDAKEVEKE